MHPEELENWKRIKEAMDASGNTNNYFYTRAVAIVNGNKDPLVPLEIKKDS